MPRLSKFGAAALAAFGWTSGGATVVTASYLQVAGGGGAGGGGAGGGGAGGLLTGTTSLNPTLSYTVVVGAGGVGVSTGVASNGSNSQFGSLTASVGGGGGASWIISTPLNGGNGGSGGGAGTNDSVGSTGTPGTGVAGQGFAGGSSYGGPATGGSGGGGGAGAVGANGATNVAGNGGVGVSSSISGTSTFYAGGGGGATSSGGSTQGIGGNGGGGTGSKTTTGGNGTANTGGGAGAGGYDGTVRSGGNGGSGIVIISYAGAQQFGGGIVTSVGGNTIHTFLTSGTLSPLSSLTASYLIVGGGGGGGNRAQRGGGGGGAGGLLSGSGVTIDTNSTYLVTVGAGGAGAAAGVNVQGSNGSNSVFGIVSTTAVGGGGGAAGGTGVTGGSGGGGDGTGNPGGAGTAGQGNNGGSGFFPNPASAGGGGGGAGAVGGTGTSSGSSGIGGTGGAGSTSSISGTSTTYAGGGGGCGTNTSSTSGSSGAGGSGGGGAGSGARDTGPNASSGTANTGGGGGGADTQTAGSGGSGIVIISYAGATQQMAGGSVTITGGNVIHTFTSSGYLTPLTYYSNSLRFRSSASAYLTRTPTTTGNLQKFTFSTWVKRGALGTFTNIFDSFPNGSTEFNVIFDPSDRFAITDYQSADTLNLTSSAVYRDPAAWYHVVAAVDTTQATSTERVKIYVNGVQITSFSTAIYPTQNLNTAIWNTSYASAIGARGRTFATPANMYLSNFNFIDGQQLTPNSFGTFNSYGVWQPINYGGSYGTNGFYLPFNSGSQTYSAPFNGSSQYLTAPASANLQLGTSDYTIEMWVYSTSYGSPVLYDGKLVGGTAIQMYFPSGVPNIYGGSGTGTLLITGSAALPTGQWNHIALTRQSNSTRLFVNGVQSGSTVTDSTNYNDATSGATIGARFGGANFFSGNMSNFRLVKGTAVYTTNFTPSTSPLTAITGTQLLTLQNATIVDNSTNAFTITNTGSVTTATSKALSTAVFQDQSPQGNNWTPNNISGATGSTLDYMTDVPTLTSTTAANYCTLNPLQLNSVTLSNGNLTYLAGTNGSLNYPCGSTLGVTSGKFYWEITVTSLTLYLGVGIASATDMATLVLNNLPIGFSASSYNVFQNGDKCNNSTTSAYQTGGYSTGNVIGVAFDATNGKIWFSKNNVFPNSGDPVAGTNAAFTSIPANTYLPALSGNNSTLSANFGQQPFVYTPPSGYVALNTYNL